MVSTCLLFGNKFKSKDNLVILIFFRKLTCWKRLFLLLYFLDFTPSGKMYEFLPNYTIYLIYFQIFSTISKNFKNPSFSISFAHQSIHSILIPTSLLTTLKLLLKLSSCYFSYFILISTCILYLSSSIFNFKKGKLTSSFLFQLHTTLFTPK